MYMHNFELKVLLKCAIKHVLPEKYLKHRDSQLLGNMFFYPNFGQQSQRTLCFLQNLILSDCFREKPMSHDTLITLYKISAILPIKFHENEQP